MASHVYAQLFKSAFLKTVNLETDALKLMLTTSLYVPSQANDRFQSAVTNEVSGTGYTAGGIAVPSVTVTDTGGTYTLSCGTCDYGVITVTGIRIAVMYDSTPGTAATNPLIWYWDIGADQSPAGIDFQIQFPSGVFTITPS